MKNTEFKIGSHIAVYGFKGIVKEIERQKEYKWDYEGKVIGTGLSTFSDKAAEEMKAKGYTMEETGRTATYFTVDFSNEDSLKNTFYNNSTYGCLDEYESYGTWED